MARCGYLYSPSTMRIFNSICRCEDVATVRNLLKHGANINDKDSKGRTPLLVACLYRRQQIVDLLIKNGANVAGKSRVTQYTVLHYTVIYGWTHIVRSLVDKVSDLNARDNNSETPIHHASKSGYIDDKDSKGRTPLLLACLYRRRNIVDLLINKGANVADKCQGNQYTVLHYAVIYGWTHIVRSLVDKVFDLNARDNNGETPIHHASRSGYLRIVKCLVEEGADIDCRNYKGITPLLYAAQCKYQKVFDVLINSKANIDGHERLILYYASMNGWTRAVKFLVTKVPNLNKRHALGEITLDATSSEGHLELVKCVIGLCVEGTDANRENEMICQAALFCASKKGHLEVVKWLVTPESGLKRVHDLNAWDISKYTALHLASISVHTEIVKYLVEQGADMNARDVNGDTALQVSAMKGHFEIVKYLVEKGADVNVTNNLNMPPLADAAFKGHKDIVDQLMSSGADFNPKRNALLHFMTKHGWTDIVQAFVQKEWDLTIMNRYGRTSLGVACFFQHYEAAQVLLQAGANWDTVDDNGTSPLDYITSNEQLDSKFIRLLIGHGAYLKPIDYYAIMKSSSLEMFQDAEICSQEIINRFNNHDLCELYKLPASENLPRIEKLTITSSSEVAQTIERNVEFEIQTKGHCNILEVNIMALSVLSVKSVLKYYMEKTSKLENGLKRPAPCDSVDNDQHSSKSMRLC